MKDPKWTVVKKIVNDCEVISFPDAKDGTEFVQCSHEYVQEKYGKSIEELKCEFWFSPGRNGAHAHDIAVVKLPDGTEEHTYFEIIPHNKA